MQPIYQLETSPYSKVRQAIRLVSMKHPMLAYVIARWKLIETISTPSFSTDGKVLRFNPTFCEQWSIQEIAWIVLHEAAHVFLGHHCRLTGKDHTQANIAFDLAVNSLIRKELPGSSKLSQFGLFPGLGRFLNLPDSETSEWYWDELFGKLPPEPPKPRPKPDDSDDEDEGDEGEDGEEDQDGEGESDDEGDEDDESDDDSQSKGKAEPKDEEDGDGQGDGEADDDGEGDGNGQGQGDGDGDSQGGTRTVTTILGPVEHHNLGDVKPEEGVDPDQAISEWQQVVGQCAQIAKTMGSQAGLFSEMAVDMVRESKIDWRLLLRQFLTRYTRTGSTYQRPNRRFCSTPYVLPANYSRSVGKGLALTDTSGSMISGECNVSLTETCKVMSLFQDAEIDLIQCDARMVGDVRTFKRQDFPITVPVEWLGRGGTNLNPAFEWARQRRQAYTWMVVVSDLEWCAATAVDPGIPVIWLSTSKLADLQSHNIPVFGHVVEVEWRS